jgi:DNA-binding CsgD family transcriptional regulator
MTIRLSDTLVNELDREQLERTLIIKALDSGGSIVELRTHHGACFRVGDYTSGPEDHRTAAAIRDAVDHLVELGLLRKNGITYTMTSAAYEEAENPLWLIHRDAAPILDLLLRIALGTPERLLENVAPAGRILDEIADAAEHGGLPVGQLLWEWAATRGDIPVVTNSAATVDEIDFLDSLISIAELFPLELSVPVEGTSAMELLPPSSSQRNHLVNRTAWTPLELSLVEGGSTDVSGASLPSLASAHIDREGLRTGEIWVRIAPAAVDELRSEPEATLNVLRAVADARATDLRSSIHAQQHRYPTTDLEPLEETVAGVSRWQSAVHSAIRALRAVDPERRAEAAAGILSILCTGKAPRETPMDERIEELARLISELDEIASDESNPKHGSFHDRLTRWRVRVTRFLRQQVEQSIADEFMGLEVIIPWGQGGRMAMTAAHAQRYREFLLALQHEITWHPDAYREAASTTPDSGDRSAIGVSVTNRYAHAYNQAMPELTLFVSHGSSDKELARLLVELFEKALKMPARQIRCSSVDGYRLPVGADTDEQLRREVFESRAFVGVITPVSVASAYVLFELGARWGAKKHLAPVLAQGADAASLGGPLRGINALKLHERSQVIQLLEDTAEHLELKLEPAASYQLAIDAVVTEAQKAIAAPSRDTTSGDSSREPELTEAEQKVLRLVADGYHQPERIALQMNVKIEKVNYYLQRLASEGLVEDVGVMESCYAVQQPGREYLFKRDLL